MLVCMKAYLHTNWKGYQGSYKHRAKIKAILTDQNIISLLHPSWSVHFLILFQSLRPHGIKMNFAITIQVWAELHIYSLRAKRCQLVEMMSCLNTDFVFTLAMYTLKIYPGWVMTSHVSMNTQLNKSLLKDERCSFLHTHYHSRAY